MDKLKIDNLEIIKNNELKSITGRTLAYDIGWLLHYGIFYCHPMGAGIAAEGTAIYNGHYGTP